MSNERNQRIQVLVTSDEKLVLEQTAKAQGASASTWLRSLGLKEARKAGVTKDGTRPTV